MERYSIITEKNPREIVLLKGKPCIWGRCTFCDYILDNSQDENEMAALNREILSNVTGSLGKLEVINSGSVFELPEETLKDIKKIVVNKKIDTVYFECHWIYRGRLHEIEDYFGIPIVFKCGIETFDNDFRNNVLKKGALFQKPEEAAAYFQSICLMVGIQGQTKEMIDRDMEILLEYFSHGCINVFNNNTTEIKEDRELAKWFLEKYAYLNNSPSIEILTANTDFGVGD